MIHPESELLKRRLIVVDDNPDIHEDIRKILLSPCSDQQLDELESELFGESQAAAVLETFEIESAFQGQEALKLVQDSVQTGNTFDLAVVDMRMPPGWDGLETIENLWRVDPDLQIVICTAFSDHSWSEITERLGIQDRFLILKKPFDDCELQQMIRSLSEKRGILRDLRNSLKSARLGRAKDRFENPEH